MAGFQGKNIVLVEDEDGFQVPMMMTEVVVVGDEDYGTGHMVEVKRQGAEMRDAAECLPGLCADGYEGTDADAIRELSRERLELLHALCVYDG